MAYNKFVTEDGTVFLDLTSDTVTPETLVLGVTAHDRSGEPVVGAYQPKLQKKTINENSKVFPDDGYDGLGEVTVDVPIPEGYIMPEGVLAILENGTHDVTAYATVDVTVPEVIPEGYLYPSGTITIKENGYYDISTFARANVEVEGSGEVVNEWIDDGKTHLWVNITEGRKSPAMCLCIYGTATIDWGDETAPTVIAGTSIIAQTASPTHEYAEAGNYVITVTVEGTMGISGDAASGGLLRFSASSNPLNQAYVNTLQKVELGEQVVRLGDYAFKNCYSLEKIKIPNSVASMGKNVFDSCYSLKEVAVPESLTAISEYAFNNCSSLEKVILHTRLTSIGMYGFGNCTSLSNILLPSSLTTIDKYAFAGCRSLSSVTIPRGTSVIGMSAFNSCSTLTTVTIPNTVTSIGNGAFGYCSVAGVYDFTSFSTVPSLPSTNIFSGIPTDCKILVQAELVNQWKTATNWSTYANRIVGV
jgi:hypothetical protein